MENTIIYGKQAIIYFLNNNPDKIQDIYTLHNIKFRNSYFIKSLIKRKIFNTKYSILNHPNINKIKGKIRKINKKEIKEKINKKGLTVNHQGYIATIKTNKFDFKIEEISFNNEKEKQELASKIVNQIHGLLEIRKSNNFPEFDNIAISGSWGIGKTTFIKDNLIPELSKKRKKIKWKYLSAINILDSFNEPDNKIKNNFYNFLLRNISPIKKFWNREFILTIPAFLTTLITTVISIIWSINKNIDKWIPISLSSILIFFMIFFFFLIVRGFYFNKNPDKKIQSICKWSRKHYVFIIDDLNRVINKNRNINLEQDIITKISSIKKIELKNKRIKNDFIFLFITSEKIINSIEYDFKEKFFSKIFVFNNSSYILNEIMNQSKIKSDENDIKIGNVINNYRKFISYKNLLYKSQSNLNNINEYIKYFDLISLKELNIIYFLKYELENSKILIDALSKNREINYEVLNNFFIELKKSNFNILQIEKIFSEYINPNDISSNEINEKENEKLWKNKTEQIEINEKQLLIAKDKYFGTKELKTNIFKNANAIINFNNIFTYKYLLDPKKIEFIMTENEFTNLDENDLLLRLIIEINLNMVRNNNLWEIIYKSKYLMWYFSNILKGNSKFSRNLLFGNLISQWVEFNKKNISSLLEKKAAKILTKDKLTFNDIYFFSLISSIHGHLTNSYFEPKIIDETIEIPFNININHSWINNTHIILNDIYEIEHELFETKKLDKIISNYIYNIDKEKTKSYLEKLFKIDLISFKINPANWRKHSLYLRNVIYDSKNIKENYEYMVIKTFKNEGKEIMKNIIESIVTSIKSMISYRKEKEIDNDEIIKMMNILIEVYNSNY